MNALVVQNPRHKNDSVTNKCRQYYFDYNNSYYNYYTEIILYLCVCALQLTPTSIRLEAQCKNQDLKKLENSFVASIMWMKWMFNSIMVVL